VLTLIALLIALLFLPSPWNVLLVAAAAIVDIAETGAFVWWSRRRRRLVPASVDVKAIVGSDGRALERIDPGGPDRIGQVRVNGEIWNASSSVLVEAGAEVTVTGVDGLLLDVAPTRLE
jgi:membrane protein implicated in regulation of membrane protease activity